MENQAPHAYATNKEYVLDMLVNSIIEMFPNLNRAQVETYVIALFNNVDEWKQFKGTVRDLMISMRSFASTENDFYEYERKVSQSLYFIQIFLSLN